MAGAGISDHRLRSSIAHKQGTVSLRTQFRLSLSSLAETSSKVNVFKIILIY